MTARLIMTGEVGDGKFGLTACSGVTVRSRVRAY